LADRFPHLPVDREHGPATGDAREVELVVGDGRLEYISTSGSPAAISSPTACHSCTLAMNPGASTAGISTALRSAAAGDCRTPMPAIWSPGCKSAFRFALSTTVPVAGDTMSTWTSEPSSL
jgi:hypothetical protein